MKYCEAYVALLDAYVDGACSPEEAAQVQAHLETCPGCCAYLHEIMQMNAAFQDLSEVEVPDGFADGIMAAVRANAAPQRKSTAKRVAYWLPRVACLALLVCAGYACTLFGGAGSAAPNAAADLDSSSQSTMAFSTAGGADSSAASSVENDAVPFGAEEYARIESNSSSGEGAAAGGGSDNLPTLASVSPFSAGTDQSSVEFQNQLLSSETAPRTQKELLAWLQSPEQDDSGITFLPGKYVEGSGCIAYWGTWSGTPHEDQKDLYLYFDDGTCAALPLPLSSAAGNASPDTMSFDVSTFTYQITFPEDSILNAGTESASVLHLKGTYCYTVDLSTKTVSLEIQ